MKLMNDIHVKSDAFAYVNSYSC